MTGLKINQPTHATQAQYARGIHAEWECEQHEEEQRHYEKTGKYWTFSHRKQWLERYFTITPRAKAHALRGCAVCEQEYCQLLFDDQVIKDNIARVRAEIHGLTRRLASKLGARERHIDRC